jgi:ubiquinone/menaquinone biosynthesis C-methylase UbiE
MSESESNAPYVPALGYAWLTRFYDPVVRLTTREGRFKRALLQQARLTADLDVLDLACGTGTLALMSKRQVPELRLHGLDGDPAVLAIARAKAARAGVDISFAQGFSTALPYPSASFDRVLSTLFFHHLGRADKQRTLAEVIRVLKPGGELHLADWGQPTGPLMRGLFYSIQLLDGFPNTRDNVAGQLPALMEAAGLQHVTVHREINTVYGTLALYAAQKPG